MCDYKLFKFNNRYKREPTNFSDTKQSLSAQVEKETKGTYRDVLIAILDENREPSNKVDNRKAQRDAEVSLSPSSDFSSPFILSTVHFFALKILQL